MIMKSILNKQNQKIYKQVKRETLKGFGRKFKLKLQKHKKYSLA